MRFRAALLVIVLLVGSLGTVPLGASAQDASCSFPVTSTDATGTEVTIEERPTRVVALAPSAAQTMWEIDAREQVVGMPVNQYTDYLNGSEEQVNVMNPDGFTINTERVVNLTPDLVLAPNIIPGPTVSKLRSAGLTVYKFEFAAELEDVMNKTRLTGKLTGNCEGANDRVDQMAERLTAIREAVEGEPRPSVIYPLGGGFVAGSGTFLHELIVTAGGENLAAEAGVAGYGTMSIEVIVTENPEWLILNEGLPKSAIKLYAYNYTTAVKENQIVRVNPNLANQPAPRVVEVVEQLARALHPEAFATPTESATGDSTETAPPTTATDRTEETTQPTAAEVTETPGQAGFGVLLALVAVLGTLAYRRVRR